MRRATTSVTITDPLVKYQTLLASGLYCPDPAQHRLAIHLQKIYLRLKDYCPSVQYRARLKAVSNTLGDLRAKDNDLSASLAVKSHPIRRNPLFAQFFRRAEGKDSLALTRVLTSHQAAIQIDSPQGLFLSGEVGTGKSMLLDLLADGLPTSQKRRWHFNTFMLYTLSQLENYRKSHSQLGRDDQQYSLLWMAKDMIEKYPILFLDEFQLPDRAASKILSNLFTVFFQLGGVLVASSNRMPEELEKATGFECVPSYAGGIIGQVLGIRKNRGKGELFGTSSDFASFLEVLKARCEFWQMEGGKDWRKRESNETVGPGPAASQTPLILASTDCDFIAQTDGQNGQNLGRVREPSSSSQLPRNYLLLSETGEDSWTESLQGLATSRDRNIPWKSSSFTVYGRSINIPRQHNGIAYWDFEDLVSSYGPADYISMASTFHTFVIDGVPVLTILKKNEARRFITLLDALYEARCKLVVRAEVGPDDIFFPEARAVSKPKIGGKLSPQQRLDSSNAILPETIAEVYQDQMSPFRPNVSTYTDSANAEYDADQDSDFHVEGQKSRLDFSNTVAFTGEDERFAYKRAASRLWEMCGAQWHARTGDGWWQPLPKEARHWESSPVSKPLARKLVQNVPGDVAMGPSVELGEPAGLQRLRIEHLRKAASGHAQSDGSNAERGGR